MRRRWAVVAVAGAVSLTLSLQPHPAAADTATTFAGAVSTIEALPYQAAYAPAGSDTAFAPTVVPNTAPAQDYTSGSIPGSPDAPAWPAAFKPAVITSTDGAKLNGMVDIAAGNRPAVLVVHGFNTHGIASVIRWAAMLAANGYDVAAFDQRDFYYESQASEGYPQQQQTFGWKETQDVLTAGTWLSQQSGVTSVGVVGFSEGAQDTVLAVSRDTNHVFSAAITFSAPADQDTQIYSTAAPPNCQTPNCTFPATDALITLVVPPGTFSDPCTVLTSAAQLYSTTPYDILTEETAMHAQTAATIPLLNFYSADDSLVAPVNATFMDAYEIGNPLQRTIEITHGEHAYFFDRWWQQSAILTYFAALLPTSALVTSSPTVNQTPAGTSLASQEVALGSPTRASVDSQLAPDICDTSQGAPGNAGPSANLSGGPPLGLLASGVLAAAMAWVVTRRRRLPVRAR